MQHHSTTGDSSFAVPGSEVELVLACSEKVKAMAWKFVRNDQRLDFDDMYQAGMLAVCEAAPNLKAGLNPFPYLTRAAHNAMVDEYRRGRGLAPLSLDAPLTEDGELCLADLLPAPAPAAASPERSKRSRALDNAMRRLASSRQRGALRRRYGLPGYGAMSLKEAGRALRISPNNVDSASREGVRSLARDMKLRQVVGVEVQG